MYGLSFKTILKFVLFSLSEIVFLHQFYYFFQSESGLKPVYDFTNISPQWWGLTSFRRDEAILRLRFSTKEESGGPWNWVGRHKFPEELEEFHLRSPGGVAP